MLISRFLQRCFIDLVNTNSFFDEVSRLHPLNWKPWEGKQETMGFCDSAISSYLFPFCSCGLRVSGLAAYTWANVNVWVFRSLLVFCSEVLDQIHEFCYIHFLKSLPLGEDVANLIDRFQSLGSNYYCIDFLYLFSLCVNPHRWKHFESTYLAAVHKSRILQSHWMSSLNIFEVIQSKLLLSRWGK